MGNPTSYAAFYPRHDPAFNVRRNEKAGLVSVGETPGFLAPSGKHPRMVSPIA